MPNNIVPFMRAQTIDFFAYGLRPNATLHVYFSDTLVDQYIKPMSSATAASGNLGDTLTSDSTGKVYGKFYVPAGVFLTGNKILAIQDGLGTDYTSKAELVFSSYINSSKSSSTSYSGRDITPITNTSTDETSDPFSQTLYVSPELCKGKDGIFTSKLNLYFAEKDDSAGLAVEIRSVVNITPTRTAFVSSKRHLNSSEINVDSTGQTATTFTFSSPVYLKAGSYYSISILPDGGSTNYSIWSGESGSIDISTNQPYAESWGKGNLFLPTNSSNWTPISNETIKFDLFIDTFASSGSVVLTNDDYEYLNISNTSAASFIVGERVAQVSANNLSGTISVSSNSNILTGTNTTFTSTFSNGQYITVFNSNTDIDVLQIVNIGNNTTLTVDSIPMFTNTASNYQFVPTGVVSFNDRYSSKLHLEQSTASNGSFIFTSNTMIVGADSQASAKVASVFDLNVNRFSSILDHSLLNETDVTFTGSILKQDYSGYVTREFDLDSPNDILESPVIVASKSNELLYNSGNKSLSLTLSFTGTSQATPEFKIGKSGLAVFGYNINNDLTGENTRTGNASAKWVSPISTLNVDAEDAKVYVSAWRPVGTDISVYVKLLNSTDPSNFVDNQWTKLEISSNTASSFSDPQNTTSYVELEYNIPISPPVSNTAAGIVTISTNSANIVGTNTSFTSSFSNGQIVRINTGLNTFDIARINTVSNNTLMNLTSNAFSNSSTATVSSLTTPFTAFKNQNNSGIVRYFTETGGTYDGYKVFAIKTVLTANTTNIVPIIDNVRGIALSV